MRLVALIVLITLAACSEPRSEDCKSVCQRETDCAEQQSNLVENYPYDLDECVAACVALERDKEGKLLVERHVECAKKATDCDELMECR